MLDRVFRILMECEKIASRKKGNLKEQKKALRVQKLRKATVK